MWTEVEGSHHSQHSSALAVRPREPAEHRPETETGPATGLALKDGLVGEGIREATSAFHSASHSIERRLPAPHADSQRVRRDGQGLVE